MEIGEAMEILARHNRWRRGDDGEEMEAPARIGQAIDLALAELRKLRSVEAAAVNMVKARGRHHSEIAYGRLVAACARGAG